MSQNDRISLLENELTTKDCENSELIEKVSRMDFEMIHKNGQELRAKMEIILEKKTETINFLLKESKDLATTCQAVDDKLNEQQTIMKRQVEVLEAAHIEATQKQAEDRGIILGRQKQPRKNL